MGFASSCFAEAPDSVINMGESQENNTYQAPKGPAEAGIQANEEESPDNTASQPAPPNVGPAEEAIKNSTEESYSDPY